MLSDMESSVYGKEGRRGKRGMGYTLREFGYTPIHRTLGLDFGRRGSRVSGVAYVAERLACAGRARASERWRGAGAAIDLKRRIGGASL
jgi:hypothetical protein